MPKTDRKEAAELPPKWHSQSQEGRGKPPLKSPGRRGSADCKGQAGAAPDNLCLAQQAQVTRELRELSCLRQPVPRESVRRQGIGGVEAYSRCRVGSEATTSLARALHDSG